MERAERAMSVGPGDQLTVTYSLRFRRRGPASAADCAGSVTGEKARRAVKGVETDFMGNSGYAQNPSATDLNAR